MRHALLKTVLLASGAALLIAAGPKADLNQDGEVTKAEFTQAAQSKFFATDANNDGFLSKDERQAHRAAMKENRRDKRFEKLDANGDGLISRAEMESAAEERNARKDVKKSSRRAKALEKYDTNLDGELSDAERTVMKAERQEKRADKKADRKENRGKRPKADANGDGFVSMDEHVAVTEQLFARMDANGDGVLTKGEGRKRKGKRGQKRGR